MTYISCMTKQQPLQEEGIDGKRTKLRQIDILLLLLLRLSSSSQTKATNTSRCAKDFLHERYGCSQVVHHIVPLIIFGANFSRFKSQKYVKAWRQNNHRGWIICHVDFSEAWLYHIKKMNANIFLVWFSSCGVCSLCLDLVTLDSWLWESSKRIEWRCPAITMTAPSHEEQSVRRSGQWLHFPTFIEYT